MTTWNHRARQAAFWLLLLFAASACEVAVASNLAESDANEVVVALTAHNIVAKKFRDPQNEGQFLVEVAEDDVAQAIGALHNAGLPLQSRPGVLQALGEGGLVATRNSEQARLVAGIAGDLETSLRAIDGVLGARVHLAVPAEDPFSNEAAPKPASASVLLRHRGNTPPLGERDVQRLVAGALTGLVPEQVAVVTYPITETSTEPTHSLTRIGPLAVTKTSATSLRLVLAGAAALNILLIVLLLWMWSRLRRARLRELPLVEGVS